MESRSNLSEGVCVGGGGGEYDGRISSKIHIMSFLSLDISILAPAPP